MPLVDLHDVTRNYGSVCALDRVSLRLEPGAIGLVGNNGAGKSTLLKILLGLIPPDSGRGEILGLDLAHARRELRGRVGYMSETAALVPILKGVEFVTLSGDLYGMPHLEARRRAHETLDYVGLGELRYRRLEEYSTGATQRLKLAAALVHDPELLLLDEPTNGLDPEGRAAMSRLIEDLILSAGKSVILCSHLLGDVERSCGQIVVLHRGTVLRAGKTKELLAESANRTRIGWRGDGRAFVAALVASGVEIEDADVEGRALALAPAGWTSDRYFELAHLSGVRIDYLKPDRENLEQVFLRVTASEPNRVASKDEIPEVVTSGSR